MLSAPFTVLVINVGTTSTDMLLDLDEGNWDFVIDTKSKRVWIVAREVVRAMCSGG